MGECRAAPSLARQTVPTAPSVFRVVNATAPFVPSSDPAAFMITGFDSHDYADV
jgi:hypothetical protein